MTEMMTAQEAYEVSEKSTAISTETTIQQFLPEISALVKEFAEKGFFEAHWDCSNILNLDEDAKDIVKLQLYLQTLGYNTMIVTPHDDFEDDDYDYYYMKISWRKD